VAGVAVFAIGALAFAQALRYRKHLKESRSWRRLSSPGSFWASIGSTPPPGMGHGPIRSDPAHPLHGNRDGPGQVTPHIGNVKDPVLKPWAAKAMQDSNDEVLSGKRDCRSPRNRAAIREVFPSNC